MIRIKLANTHLRLLALNAIFIATSFFLLTSCDSKNKLFIEPAEGQHSIAEEVVAEALPSPIKTTATPSVTPLTATVAEIAPARFIEITTENAHKLLRIGDILTISKASALVYRESKTWLADAVSPQEVQIIDLESGEKLAGFLDETAHIEKLTSSDDGQYLAVTSPTKGKVSVWNLSSFELQYEFGFSLMYSALSSPAIYQDVTFSPDNHYLIVAGCRSKQIHRSFSWCKSSDVYIYDLFSGLMHKALLQIQWSTISVSVDADSSRLAMVGWGEKHLQALIWDIAAEQEMIILDPPETQIWAAAFSDSRLLTSGSTSGYGLLAWDTKTWEPLDLVKTRRPVRSISLQPQPDFLITHDSAGTITLWDKSELVPVHEIYLPIDPLGGIQSVHIDPGGKKIYVIVRQFGFDDLSIWGVPANNSGP